MPYDIPFSKLSRDTQAILSAMGEPYQIRVKEISDNCKAILDAIGGFKQDEVTEAPKDGQMYARINGQWAVVTAGGTVLDAPSDGQAYMRMNAAWTPLTYQDRAPDYDSGSLPVIGPGASLLITHNLGVRLEFLNVKVMLHRPTDTAWIDAGTLKDGGGAAQEGFIISGEYASLNAFRIEVGTNGLALLGGAAGWIFPVDLIRVLIWKNTDRVVVAPAGMEEDIHYYVDPLNHLYDHVIGRYYTIDGTWKPIYKATVNIPMFSMTPGVMQDVACTPDNIVDTLVGVNGFIVNQTTPTAQIAIPTSFASSDITTTRSILIYKFSTGSIVVRDYCPAGWSVLSYNGEITVKFTAVKDSWQT
jgi:hypothetical protein